MTDRKFYRNIITIEVLSEDEPYVFNDFDDLHYDINDGHFSGRCLGTSSKTLNGVQAVKALQNQGSDPEFFGLTENGEDNENF